MLKKLLTGISALGLVISLLPLIAAYEAHVINVTAQIENGLLVPIDDITFGTVFPQEELDKRFNVAMSQSFLDEPTMDDIEYVIRQKPKCGLPQEGNPDPVVYLGFGVVKKNEEGTDFECKDQGYVELPLLCPYLSKHEITSDGTAPDGENDSEGIPAFHGLPGDWNLQTTLDTQVSGRLAKSEEDTSDTWNLDLKAPCFANHCAQDWEDFVVLINPDAHPNDYIQPLNLEHELFGCDLWLEITGVSTTTAGCDKKVDIMLVLDRSGSIDAGELATLKSAAKSYVDTVAPSADNAHVGMTSFATTGSFDHHLSDNGASVKAAIDVLVAGGFTNLSQGIDLAKGEFDNPGDGHDRADIDSSDFMVVITDGAPNRPGGLAAGQAAAIASADAAKADGITIFVIGVGTTGSTADYLKDNIATSPAHYFDAADFTDLEPILAGLATCE